MINIDYEFGDEDTFRMYDPDYENISFTIKRVLYGSGYRNYEVTLFHKKDYYKFTVKDFVDVERLVADKIKELGRL